MTPGGGHAVLFTANAVDRPLATVTTRDIAAAAAGLLLDTSWSGQRSVPVVGPDRRAPSEMARIMSEVLDRPVRVQQTGLDAYKATMTQYGMSDARAQGPADMAAAQNDGIYDAEQNALTSPAPTGFRQWCQDVPKPAVLA